MVQLRWVQRVHADAETIWEACATPAGLARWQADVACGEVEPGGNLRLEWPMLGVAADLDVEEVVPPARLTMRNGDARVLYEIVDGGVTLTHAGLSSEDDLEGFASSWRCALSVLAHSVERQAGRNRTVSWEVKTLRTSPEIAHTMFTDARALGAWLGRSSGVGSIGSEWHVELQSGTLRGRVLCHVPGRDVSLSYDDGAAVVVLRTLPSARGERERTVAIQHARYGPRVPRNPWAGALDRLAALLRQGGES